MVNVTFSETKNSDNTRILILTLKGHAAYAPAGQDIVCSAVSTLYYCLVSIVEDYKDCCVEIERRHQSGDCEIKAIIKNNIWNYMPIKHAYDFAVAGYKLLAATYPKNVSFKGLENEL